MLILIFTITILVTLLGLEFCFELISTSDTLMNILGAILFPTMLLTYYYLIKLFIYLKDKKNEDN